VVRPLRFAALVNLKGLDRSISPVRTSRRDPVFEQRPRQLHYVCENRRSVLSRFSYRTAVLLAASGQCGPQNPFAEHARDLGVRRQDARDSFPKVLRCSVNTEEPCRMGLRSQGSLSLGSRSSIMLWISHDRAGRRRDICRHTRQRKSCSLLAANMSAGGIGAGVCKLNSFVRREMCIRPSDRSRCR